MTLTQIFSAFGDSCGITGLRLEEGGSASLCFDDTLEVSFIHDAEDRSLLLSAPVCSVAGITPESLRLVLEATLFGARTRGGALSIDARTEELVYWKRHDAAVFREALDLADAVERFLAELVRIRTTAQEHRTAGTSAAPAADIPAWALCV